MRHKALCQAALDLQAWIEELYQTTIINRLLWTCYYGVNHILESIQMRSLLQEQVQLGIEADISIDTIKSPN